MCCKVAGLQPNQLTSTKASCCLLSGWFPSQHRQSKAQWEYKAAHYTGIRVNVDCLFPKLCMKMDGEVDLGFGTLHVLGMSLSVCGKSQACLCEVPRKLWKKHQVGIWQMSSLQQHPDMAVSTGGLTRITGLCQCGKTMDCNFLCSDVQEVHF